MPIIRDDYGRFMRQLFPWSLDNYDNVTVRKGERWGDRCLVYIPNHPRACNGLLFRSIAAYEVYHGVSVPLGMEIHHINGDTMDDSEENLVLLTNSEHQKLEAQIRGERMVKPCLNCGEEFTAIRHRNRVFCGIDCYHKYPMSKSHRENISKGLKKAYMNGVR